MLCGGLVAGPALGAEPQATLLHLEATGTAEAVPDRLVAEMTADGADSQPAGAQRRVNRLIQQAIQAVAGAGPVSWVVSDYGVSQDDGRQPAWRARQTLRLESASAEPLLALVGRLQAGGLALAALTWTVSPDRLARAQAEAADRALRTLRVKAAAAAGSLGLKVGTIRDVTLGDREGVRPMMRAMAAGMAQPVASQAAQAVGAVASAEIELHP